MINFLGYAVRIHGLETVVSTISKIAPNGVGRLAAQDVLKFLIELWKYCQTGHKGD